MIFCVKLNLIIVEVIGLVFVLFVEEMGEVLVCVLYFMNIKECCDCLMVLFDVLGWMLCQVEYILMYLGSFIGFILWILCYFGEDVICLGDVFMGNDVYEGGGIYLFDIVLVELIFVEGKLVVWVINIVYYFDFVDWGYVYIYQEGLCILLVCLYCEGQLQDDIQWLFLLNCQVFVECILDFRVQLVVNWLGSICMIEFCVKYGLEIVLVVGLELMDYVECKMCVGISVILDGCYIFLDVFDSEVLEMLLDLLVIIDVKGDQIVLDFVSLLQVCVGLNVVYIVLLVIVYYVVKIVVDLIVLFNVGLVCLIIVIVKEGMLLCCVYFVVVDGCIIVCQWVVDLIYGVLVQVVLYWVIVVLNGLVVVVYFNGWCEDGGFWVYFEIIGGGFGVCYNKDGLDGVYVYMINILNLLVEVLENEYLIMLCWYELVDGLGGDGQFVGGMGLCWVYCVEKFCWVQVMGVWLSLQFWGLDGGQLGVSGYFMLNGECSGFECDVVDLVVGDVLEIVMLGVGGYGVLKMCDVVICDCDLWEKCFN